jgi:hypothetical protein
MTKKIRPQSKRGTKAKPGNGSKGQTIAEALAERGVKLPRHRNSEKAVGKMDERPIPFKPVESEIRRAAERLNGKSNGHAPEPAVEARTDEIAKLRDIASQAAQLFETGDEPGGLRPVGILREALRATADEISIISFANEAGGGVYDTSMMTVRLERRIALALAVYDFTTGGAS